MTEEVYVRLAECLDTLPNGFPRTESGVEFKILKKIFTPEEADLFCDLRLSFETADQIAARTGRPLDGLAELLDVMTEKGHIFGFDIGGIKIYKMLPWVFGIYEFQLHNLDRELSEMNEEYAPDFSRGFFGEKPHLMQVIPIEKEIPVSHQALPYEQVSSIIETGQSFAVNDCICKKEKALLGRECDKPREVCLAIAPIPNCFDNGRARVLTKREAYELLEMAEEAGLVHMTYNTQGGHIFICNCCGCCCGILQAMNAYGAVEVANSHFYAEIDADGCIACGICADERCQVNAIELDGDAYRVIRERCIGCGICVSKCPTGAVSLKRKPESEIIAPPKDQDEWFEERGKNRAVDFSKYK